MVMVEKDIVKEVSRDYGTFELYSNEILQQKEKSVEDLIRLYGEIKDDIDNRLDEFSSLWERADDSELYHEMAFCMCTPQTNAKNAWKAVTRLKELDYIENGDFEQIAFILKDSGVRFHKNKTTYIVRNKRKFFWDTHREILRVLNGGDIVKARNKFADEVVGWGMKEASHFMRNIGFGDKICILDRHILRQLQDYGVISKIPKTMTKGDYLAIENDMRHFAQEIGVPVDALDLVFWYKAKNEIFK